MEASAVEVWLKSWAEHAEDLVHPLDQDCINKKAAQLNLRRRGQKNIYAPKIPVDKNDLARRTGQFRHELGALPFVGNIREASIFLLMINPGVSWNDYIDRADPLIPSLFMMNKRQELKTCFGMEPNAAQGWSPYYLNKVFGGVLARYKGSDSEQARVFLSQKLAILELVPYFSQNISLLDQLNLDQELATARLAKSAARELASDPRNLIITRWTHGERRWGLDGTVRSTCRHGLGQRAKEALWDRIDAGIR